MTNLDQINSFLHYNYLPKAMPDNRYYEEIVKCSTEPHPETNSLNEIDHNDLIEIGIKYLKEAIDSIEESDKTYIIPLSGGLDSRAILAGLLEKGINNLVTVTLGVPGALDYDIGRYIAEKAGVKNEPLNINEYSIKHEDLLKTAGSLNNCPYLFHAHSQRLIYKIYGKDALYVSGFLGGELAGQNLPKKISENWGDAVTNFIRKNSYCKKVSLVEPGFNLNSTINDEPFLKHSLLSYEDQLVLGIRQQYCLVSVLLPEGYINITPFLNNNWLRFVLNLPFEYRKNEFLYKEILQKAYPRLFSLNVKNNLGLPLRAPGYRRLFNKVKNKLKAAGNKLIPDNRLFFNNRTLLIDYDKAIRERRDYKKLVYEAVMNLKARKYIYWLDIDKLWNDHQNKRANNGIALIILASLEFYLSANKIEID